MKSYEAVIDLSVVVEATDSEQADYLILGELTDKLLAIANDTRFKIWLDVLQIEETNED